ncbi:MAG: hypothetical protein JXR70_09620 [Spirochaetales bacterium]|nr:hypothetical protein [Spirochaetales bacterium]
MTRPVVPPQNDKWLKQYFSSAIDLLLLGIGTMGDGFFKTRHPKPFWDDFSAQKASEARAGVAESPTPEAGFFHSSVLLLI